MKAELQPWRPAPEAPWPPARAAKPVDRFFQAKLLHAQLQRYLQALRHRWWVVVVALVLIGGPALVYAWRTPPSFQSRAQMYYSGGQNEEINFIATQAQLLKSPRILARAFTRVRSQFPAWKAGAKSPFELAVRSSQKTSVVELKATGPAPATTRAFLDAVMTEYQLFKQDEKAIYSTSELTNYVRQGQEVEQQIKQEQSQLALFQTSNNVAYLEELRRNAGSHLAQLSGTVSDLRTERQTLELMTPAEYEKFAGTLNTPLETVRYQTLQQLQMLQARGEELAAVLRPEHSKMIKLKQDLASQEQLLERLNQEVAQQALERMSNRKKTLDLQIQAKANEYRTWETNAAEASRVLLEYDRLKQDLQRLQTHYDNLMIQVEMWKIKKYPDPEGVLWPIDSASVAQPTLTRHGIAAAGLFLALLVGMGVFMFLEFLDDRFTSAMELSLQLPAEVVGQIPRTSLSLPDEASHLLPLTTAQPAFAESFRNLRSSLLFMSGQEVPPKLVLITSAIPKEGKTTVASNLAGILAMAGVRVLLVDADFRRGYIHRIFRLRRQPGLLEALREEVALEQAIVASGQPNLFVLPAGETGDYTSDVLLRYRVDRLLQTLAKGYDHVIVDSAPVLATDDAACLGPYTDGAFLVVRAAYTSSRMTQEAWGRLARRNVKVLGVIYNCAPESTDYYCHYSRDYGVERAPEPPKRTRASRAEVEGEAARQR